MELRDVKAVRSLEETGNRYWKANVTLPSPIPFFFFFKSIYRLVSSSLQSLYMAKYGH